MDLTYQAPAEGAFFRLTDVSDTFGPRSGDTNDYFRIVWIKEGQTSFRIDGMLFTSHKDQVLFLTPHHKVDWDFEPGQVAIFSFNREFYCVRDHDREVSCYGHLFYGSSEIPVIDLDESEQKSFELLREVFVEEFHNRDHIQGEMLQMLLKRLLIKSTRLARKHLQNPDLPQHQLDVIRQFNVLVEMHFREKHQVADYAELLFKSPKTLSNLFAQYNDRSPLQVITDRILLEARRLLLNTDRSNKEIAYELGYESASHFSKFFKNGVGTSPKEFRKSHLAA